MVKYAGLVIDLQDYSLDDSVSHAEAMEAARNSVRLLKRMSRSRIPKVIMEFLPDDPVYKIGRTLPVVMDHFDRKRDIVVKKDYNDAFSGTEKYDDLPTFDGYYTSVRLLSYLRRLGVTNLVVTGWHRNFCVKRSVTSALNNGFKVHTSPDIVGPTEYPSRGLSQQLYDGNARKLLVYRNVDELLKATIIK